MVIKDLRVLIIEDDPYSSSFMSMLLARDWRTHVIGEMGGLDEAVLHSFLAQPANRVDLIIIDAEIPADPRLPFRIIQMLHSQPHPPVLVFTCTHPDALFLQHILQENGGKQGRGGGYLVKSEILYALAPAVVAAANGKFVFTPGSREAIQQTLLPANFQVMDGTVPVAAFTRRENDLVRLGLLFNLTQRDIADELVVSGDFVSEVMGHIYEKLGVHDLLSGETPLETYFHDEVVLDHLRRIIVQAQDKNGRPIHKAPWLSTIAFHLLTGASEE